MIFSRFILFSLLAGPGLASYAAEPPSESWTFTFRFENDMFSNADRFYTNGLKLNWISPDLDWFQDLEWFDRDGLAQDVMTGLISTLPYHGDETRQRNLSLSLGQMIYTPAEIKSTELQVNDRPYAGWLYLSTAFHSKNYRELDTFEIQVGVTGRYSLANEAQDVIHEIWNIPEARGWEHQIAAEPGIALVYDYKYRLIPHLRFFSRWGLDTIIHLGGSLGNVYTYLDSGIEVRAGWNLPADFGTALIRPAGDTNAPTDTMDVRYSKGERPYSAHLFMAASGRVVLRDIFLDGNTFTDSHSVEKRPAVGDLVIGASLIYKHFKLSYAHVFRSREFEKQRLGHNFGSISISYTY